MKIIIKKITRVVFVLMLCFSTIIKPVFADMGAPEPLYEQIIIINEGGTWFDAGKFSTSIPYGEIVEVYYEDDWDDTIQVQYNGRFGNINKYDAKPVIDEMQPSDQYKIKPFPKNVMTYSSDIYLYKGPSTLFDKVSEEPLPINEVIECTHTTSPLNEWSYVKYKGFEGWVHDQTRLGVYDFVDYIPGKGTLFANTTVYDNPPTVSSNGEKNYQEVGKVDSEEEVKVLYGFAPYRNQYYYVKSSNIEGWVEDSQIIRNSVSNKPVYCFSFGDETVYSDIGLSNVIGKYALSGELTFVGVGIHEYENEYGFVTKENAYEIEYEPGKAGFIKKENTLMCLPLDKKNISLSREAELYSVPDWDSDYYVGTLPAETKFAPTYVRYDGSSYYVGVEQNKEYNWIQLSSGEFIENYENVRVSSIEDSLVSISGNQNSAPGFIGMSTISTDTIVLIAGAVLVAGLAGASIFFFTRKPKVTK